MTPTGPPRAASAELTAGGLAALGPGNACDTEPIHLSGEVQGHGVLLVVDPASMVVVAASANASRLTSSVRSPLGAALTEVIGPDAAEAARSAHTTGNPHDGLPVEVHPPGTDGSGPTYDMVAHRRGSELLLEFEVVDAVDRVGSERMYQQQRDAVNALHRVDRVQAICELTVARVRELTGYDRVMIYRFAPDAHGHVIAEARAADLTPFLGLHYPATDIPRQARALFLQNWIRVIADVHEPPVAITTSPGSTSGDALDLSMCVLRSVSPMHLRYLRNMDVGASMTISLIVDNELWGLIACHHRTAKRTGHLQRLACEALGQLVSVRLRAAQTREDQEYGVELGLLRAQVLASIADNDSMAAGAAAAPQALLDMVAADGVVLEMDGERVTVGVVPEPPEVDALLARLAEQAATDTEPLAVDSPLDDGPATGAAPCAAATGVLYLPLAGRPDGFILWLRGERAETVRWAGRPDATSATPDTQLGPRASFDEWLDEVHGHSAPWRPAEVAAAVELGRAMPETLLRRAQSRLVRLALHDPLTGLPNRTLMYDRLVDLLDGYPVQPAGDSQDSSAGVGLLFIDLDGFKGVNDTRGHLVGDHLLVLAAERLLEVVRPQDTVARIGGDEFVILVPRGLLEQTVAIGQRVVETLRQSYVLGEEIVRSITASVGVTVVSAGTAAAEAIRQADSAMYYAKHSGRNQLGVYDTRSGTATSRRRLAEDEVRLALRAHEITVDYQPIMRLVPDADPVLHGFEARARWEHPTRGHLTPDEIGALAEGSGLLDSLGDAVLDEALRQLRAWDAPGITIAVDVSVQQLLRPGFAAEVMARLVDHGIDPTRLVLEVPEPTLIDEPGLALAGLLECHAAGIQIGLDDYGAGGTSMTYLRDLPVTVLKIDRSLVASLADDDRARAVVGAIIHLAHALGAQTVAKGVETAAQQAVLEEVGSDFAQGRVFGEPLPPSAAWPAH